MDTINLSINKYIVKSLEKFFLLRNRESGIGNRESGIGNLQ
ncbi:hypothetical protein [Moorena producens]